MTPKEAKRLKIGCSVIVRATVEIAYVSIYAEPLADGEDWLGRKVKHEERQVLRTELSQPRILGVVGARNRPLGKYVPMSSGTQDEGPDPPQLDVTGTVLVICLRERLFGRVVEALPEDIELYEPAGGTSVI